MDWTKVEYDAIESILSEPVEGMDILKRQFASATVIEREYTGVGFYTTLSVPDSLPPAPNTLRLRQAIFHSGTARVKSDPEELILFHLWLRAGYLCTLEAVTSRRDYWPDESDIAVNAR